MHPEIARALVAQRRQELARSAAVSLPGPSRLFPRWRISWSRMTLPPAGAPAPLDAERAAVPGRLGSSLVIIISAYRSA
jgi:hypothetical protein